jgi:hypothetical protein
LNCPATLLSFGEFALTAKRGRRRPRFGGRPLMGPVRIGCVLAGRTQTRRNELGLSRTLTQRGRRSRDDGVSMSERALVLVANRLIAPTSEHGLARWLETDFVCDGKGRRFVAAWRDEVERKASRTPRVHVAPRQLQQCYRTLDQLLERKTKIEQDLYLTLRNLFSLKVDVVFYALSDQVKRFFETLADLSTSVLTLSTNSAASVAVVGAES